VVTEYGVADLYGKTIRQRARQLDHPDFRADCASRFPRADLEKQAFPNPNWNCIIL
jgi:acyl-CoA hydrolase